MKESKIKYFIELHILLFLYSLGGICSKFAGRFDFLSSGFLLFYGMVLLDLVLYAVAWQQILKHLSLVTAYANKAVTVLWGLFWGAVIFKESIGIRNIEGAAFIIVGIYLVVKSDED